jgi:hypothetical protein
MVVGRRPQIGEEKMAYLVTNPMKRRRNGAINSLVYKHLKLSGNKNSPANKAAITAFKRSAGYKAWAAKNATAAKVQAERKAIKPSAELIEYRKKQYAAAKAKKSGASAEAPKAKRGKKKAVANPRHRRHNPIAVRANGIAARFNPKKRHNGRHAMRHNRRHRRNPGAMEAIKAALRQDLNLPFAATAVGAGAAHFFATPYVMQLVGKLGDNAATRFLQERVPYTTTGLIAGVALSAVAAVAMPERTGQAVRLGSGLFFLGAGLDTIGYLTDRQEAVGKSEAPATDKSGAYGGLGAFSVSPYAGIEADYAEAKMADAAVCGADFSDEEGQALIDGPEAVVAVAGGRAPSAQGFRHADSGATSRFAGRPMHRWGWLIKCVGFQRAAQIAALSPAQRIKVIAALRKQAMAAVDAATEGYGVLYNEGKLVGAYAGVEADMGALSYGALNYGSYSGLAAGYASPVSAGETATADYGAVVTVGAAL